MTHERSTPRHLDKTGIARVKEVWGETTCTWRNSQRVHWTQHPKVQERLNLLTSGSPRKNRFEYFMDAYLRGKMPVERALTLGCGQGELERGLSQYNFALLHEAVDLADGAVAEAARLANEAGLKNLSYRMADLNSIQLPRETYDVIFGVSAIHHVAALEHVFQQVSRSLKPQGYFFLDEFVGPSQFQWPDRQLAAVNAQLAALPERFKVCVDQPGALKGPVTRISIEEMNAFDPSEAVRSSEILGLLSEFFDVKEIRGFGGSLLHLLLEHIAGNFDENDPASMDCLQSLFDAEDQLIAAGTLQHDFGIAIAAKR